MTAHTTTHLKCDRCGILGQAEPLEPKDLRYFMAISHGWLSEGERDLCAWCQHSLSKSIPCPSTL